MSFLQVTDVLEESSLQTAQTSGMRLSSGGRDVAPALGLAWSNCMNMRVFLSKGPEQWYDQGMGSTLRCMQIVFSPMIPQSYCYYTVTRDGVKGLSNAAPEISTLQVKRKQEVGEETYALQTPELKTSA